MLAERYEWTPDVVARLDPEFAMNLMAYIAADAAVQRARARKAERQKGRPDLVG